MTAAVGAARGQVYSRIWNAPPGCVSSVFLEFCELIFVIHVFILKLAKVYTSFA